MQVGLLLLRVCHLPRYNYLSRTTPPELSRPHLRRADEAILGVLQELARLPPNLSDVAKKQIHLPIRLGGLGLRSLGDVADAAFCAAVAEAMPAIAAALRRLRGLRPDQRVQLPRGFFASFSEVHASLINRGIPADDTIVPTRAEDAIGLYGGRALRRLQRYLTVVLESRQHAELLHSIQDQPADQARLLSASAKHSAAFLTVIPSHQRFRLNDTDMRRAVSLRLGVSVTRDLQGRCQCGMLLREAPPTHFLHCKKEGTWKMVHRRHGGVRDTLLRIGEEGRVPVDAEVELPAEVQPIDRDGKKKHLRPDLRMQLPDGQVVYLDTSIVDPTAPSRARRDPRALQAAEEVEGAKEAKYREAMVRLGSPLVPFVAETYGALGKQAIAFLQKLATQVADAQHWHPMPLSYSSILRRMVSEVAITIHRGNSGVITEGLRRAGLAGRV
jgi:hypothetical protein